MHNSGNTRGQKITGGLKRQEVAKIVLADDHHVIRQALKSLLEVEPDFRVVGEASDGVEALNLVCKLQPDVLVIDMVMPGMNGIDVLQRICRLVPRCISVVLSMYGAEAYVRQALKTGAKAYVLKKDTAEQLVFAIREAINGRLYVSPNLATMAIKSYFGSNTSRSGGYDALTRREREVLRMVAAGYTSAQIATRLTVSRRTIEFHRANVMGKLHINNEKELVRYCLESGILPLDARENSGLTFPMIETAGKGLLFSSD